MSSNGPLLLKVNGLWTQFIEPLRERTQFRTHGALYGVPGKVRSIGKLPQEYREPVSTADYVVYSWDTPIAWHTQNGWIMPDVRYSVSTSKQQSRIHTALAVIEQEEEES
jgi:hypothetical protein